MIKNERMAWKCSWVEGLLGNVLLLLGIIMEGWQVNDLILISNNRMAC